MNYLKRTLYLMERLISWGFVDLMPSEHLIQRKSLTAKGAFEMTLFINVLDNRLVTI